LNPQKIRNQRYTIAAATAAGIAVRRSAGRNPSARQRRPTVRTAAKTRRATATSNSAIDENPENAVIAGWRRGYTPCE
jgi:hypothetical protein